MARARLGARHLLTALVTLWCLTAGAEEDGCSAEAAALLPPLPPQRVFIATPMYGGTAHGSYVLSLLSLTNLLRDSGVEVEYEVVMNESLITRARNALVARFLRSNATHLLFLDADVAFEASDVLAMLALGKEFVGAPYPKKGVNWAAVAEAARRHPDMPAEELDRLVGYYVINFLEGTQRISLDAPVQVRELGTGLLLLQRRVVTELQAAYPERQYKPVEGSDATVAALFDTSIDADGRYVSEDFFFCGLWTSLGGAVWLVPWVRTTHTGSYAFQGDLRAVSARLGSLHGSDAGVAAETRTLRW